MIVEHHGTMYRLGFDVEAIQKIAYSLVITGEQEVAFQILTNSFCTEEQAQVLIDGVTKHMKKEEVNIS